MRLLLPLPGRLLLPALALCVAAAGCTSPGGDDDDSAGPADAGAPPDAGTGESPDAGGLLLLHIFHTSDEHGWLQPETADGMVRGGAANVEGWWTQVDGLDRTKDLVLSGGDCWTGPAISTWFKGESTVEVMNQMGYGAQAVGNHEFDFGMDVLRARAAQANYPLLAANLHSDTVNLDFVAPYLIQDVQGVKVGILGLVTPSTEGSTNVANIGGLVFDDLKPTIQRLVPEMRDAGAEVVIILAHEDFTTMSALAATLSVPVDLIYAAHGHEVDYGVRRGVPVIANGTQYQEYSVTTLSFDPVGRYVVDTATEQRAVEYSANRPNAVDPDPAVAAVVEQWQGRTDAALSEEIGYTATGLPAPSWILSNWIVDTWRWANPQADLAIQNFGSFRQGVDRGAVTLEDIVSVMPFQDAILELQLTGAQVVANVATVTSAGQFDSCWPAVSGMTWTGTGDAVQVLLGNGQPLDPAATYRVLVSDYIYGGGCNYQFARQDGTPVDTGMDERQPVINWTRAQATTSAHPLERILDSGARGPAN